jgi:hypothetical protein
MYWYRGSRDGHYNDNEGAAAPRRLTNYAPTGGTLFEVRVSQPVPLEETKHVSKWRSNIFGAH